MSRLRELRDRVYKLQKDLDENGPSKWVEMDWREAMDLYNEERAKYNWKMEGPGGCDSHCIEHPCGECALEDV